ncbi:substrate-binding domain-containing protein [Paracidobacterium acidisoli]|uniref:Sugar ABC transporter substrate-binding protein n=1 Tax=Paracidobacterium acidisoli TaxID=2303751 RepID=A0A372IK03_9BACT|nr:substrate-binding domain-containing protein [Paracidobacterium acidisoli]MBT9332581.1 substrate-binding domain-containing protein [Paracidobacterium acidisoli]
MPKSSTRRLYLIPILSKALDILELLQKEEQPMALEAIFQRTRISKTTVYRILKTFVHRGYLAQSQDGLYRLVTRPRKVRFGFGKQSAEMPFSEEVTASLRAAASQAGVDLLVLDNHYDAATAIRTAEEFVRNRVDLAIEFQIDQQVAPIIADKIAAAGIPLIAIDIPHPHATYFGVDNYRVGVEAGELLARYAQERWRGKAEWILGLDIEEAGPLVQSRITGSFQGIRNKLPNQPIETFVRMDGRGMRDKSSKLIAEFLNRHPKDRHILIAAATDTSALGALEAVRELKRERHVAIAGQDCIPEALEEMQRPDSPWVGSVSHEAPSYGPYLIQLGLSILRGQTVPPYNYVEHKLVTGAAMAKAEQG